jgi:hypothetical protein
VILAHVGGVPVEEMLPALAGAGAGLLIIRTRLTLRVQRRRERGT